MWRIYCVDSVRVVTMVFFGGLAPAAMSRFSESFLGVSKSIVRKIPDPGTPVF
jgi:hypothetical protein